MKKLFTLLIPFLFYAQMGVGETIQLERVNASLMTIINQNNLGFQNERAQLVQLINSAQDTYRSFQELQQMYDLSKSVYEDLKSISKWNINSINDLKTFIQQGDQLSYWAKSSSYALTSNMRKVVGLEKNARRFGREANNMYELLKPMEAETSTKTKNIKIEDIKYKINEIDMLFANTEQLLTNAQKLFELANDRTSNMTDGERNQLFAKALDLIRQANQDQQKAINKSREVEKIVDKHKTTMDQNENNAKMVNRVLEFAESNANYGLYNSEVMKRKAKFWKFNFGK